MLFDFILLSRRNQVWRESGLDSQKKCLDRKHFDSYPYSVEYRYNSRGFRDAEWPKSFEELKNSIWCFGDSFTVGIGSSVEHTWVNILQRRTGIRCINVSMDGASNEWIARKINRVLEEINPQWIVVQWSYLHRTESSNTNLIDESRQIYHLDNLSEEHQIDNFKKIRSGIKDTTVHIIESFIPESITPLNGPTEFIELEIEQIDFARDGHHYDHLTAGKFVDSIIGQFKLVSS